MLTALKHLLKTMTSSLRDLLPIILVIAFFQFLVLQQPLPNVSSIFIGTVLVVLGLTFFIYGLEMGLFPIGESMATAFARKGSVLWLLIFAFALGFGTTVAEPALIAVAAEAANVAANGGMIDPGAQSMQAYADGLRLTVAFSVGLAIVIGVFRILKGWPLHYFIIVGYILVVIMTTIAPKEIIGIAYDSGGVTTSTITVPLVTALGVGLASSIKGRNPMIDGFGLIALASLTPMIFVMGYGLLIQQDPSGAVSAGELVIETVKQTSSWLDALPGWLSVVLASILATVKDVIPIAAIIIGFQLFVIRKPVPNVRKVVIGFAYVLVGLSLFLLGLEKALFPLGKLMAEQLTDPAFIQNIAGIGAAIDWQHYYWVYLFAFAIGFSTTVAEPSLIAVAIKAREVSAGAIGIWGLRIAVAIGVAMGISLGSWRIVTGLPLHWFIITGYIIVVIQTFFAPKMIVPLAYDSGGVTTSTVTVPLVAALGLGLAETVPGRSVLLDGFGLIAFASLFPMMTVMAYAQISEFKARKRVSE